MLLILIVFLTISYFVGKKDMISPCFLLCLAFFAFYCVIMLNYVNWNVHIGGKFILYVSTAIISFILGGVILKASTKRYSIASNAKTPLYSTAIKYKYPVNILAFISIAFTFLYAYKMFSDAGGGSLSERLRSIYDNIVINGYSPGFVFNQMLEVVAAIAYVNTFRLMQRIFSRRDRISVLKLLIPIVMFFVIVLVSTDRNIFLRYAIYFACIYVLFFMENKSFKHMNAALIRRVAIMVLVVVVIFFIMGLSKQYSSGIFRSISIYGGSGLYNFNLWLDGVGANTSEVGSATFSTFLRVLEDLLGRIGIHVDIATANRFDEFITFVSPNGYVYGSNIYSALKPFVQDLGYFGVIFFPFILGVFYQWLYIRAKKYKYTFSWVIYCMLIYPVVFFPIAEQMFARWTLSFIYELVWLAIVFFAVYGGKRYRTLYHLNESKIIKGVQII